MTEVFIDQQEHGYRSGHQLLSASLRLPRDDQDLIDRLSDMSGQLRPGETFTSYLTTYPLPSEKYYVVARTWQDLEAPRAGCVRTRSLLVPMPMWQTIEGVGRLLPLLTPVAFGEKAVAVPLPAGGKTPPVVSDPRAVELVEALFLEDRQPIVFFEASDAEAIAVRVIAALWPGLKRRFATCTFTLAPRKIVDRDFDLVFAPKSARTRFADWSGRRIEVGASQKPRHRWSQATWQQIFQSDAPSLVANDGLGVLRHDDRGDEAALRLSLLWNELSAKADTTPNAVLGMLDILNLQKERTAAYGRLAPLILRAVRSAAVKLDVAEAWRFLAALVVKLPTPLPSMSLAKSIERAAADLATKSGRTALQYLELESSSSRGVPAVILAGLGNGLTAGFVATDAGHSLPRISSDIGAGLIGLSDRFARDALSAAKLNPDAWIAQITRFVSYPDRTLQTKARRRLTPLLDDASQAPLLPSLLAGVTAAELVDFVVQIGRKTAFGIPEFDEPIGNGAKDAASLFALRDVVAKRFDNDGANRLLYSTLNVDSADITWLNDAVPDKRRALRLLVRLLENAPDRTVIAVQRDAEARDRMIGLLLEDVSLGSSQIGRILAVGDLPIDRLLDVGLMVLPSISPDEAGKLAEHLVSHALVEADSEDPRVAQLLAAPSLRISPEQLIQLAASRSANARRIGSNLVLLASTPSRLRHGVSSRIDDLSDRLVHRGRENLGEPAYRAWAALITDAGAIDRDTQLRACLPTLAFALRLPDLPVNALVRAAFPVVYAQLLKSTGDEDFNLIPRLMLLPMTFFNDWDRAKTARHELVDTFLHSSWPPSELLLIAIEAGIDGTVVKRLSRSSRGREYLSAVERDSMRLTDGGRALVRGSLSGYLHD